MPNSVASDKHSRIDLTTSTYSSILTQQPFAWRLSHQILLSLSVFTRDDGAMNLFTQLSPSLKGQLRRELQSTRPLDGFDRHLKIR